MGSRPGKPSTHSYLTLPPTPFWATAKAETALGAGPGPLDSGRNRHSTHPRRGGGSKGQAGE